MAILPVYSSYTDARWSKVTPSSFICSRRSIGSLPRASARLTTTRSTFSLATIRGMSAIVPMTPGFSTGSPTRSASVSTKPTISTPSSLRRSWISRASATEAALVPTSSRRSLGPTRRAAQSNSTRHADHDAQHQARGDEEDAPADDQVRQPEIGERRAAATRPRARAAGARPARGDRRPRAGRTARRSRGTSGRRRRRARPCPAGPTTRTRGPACRGAARPPPRPRARSAVVSARTSSAVLRGTRW